LSIGTVVFGKVKREEEVIEDGALIKELYVPSLIAIRGEVVWFPCMVSGVAIMCVINI